MAKLTIDTGTAGNPATGDTLRTAMTKVNANFDELYIGLMRSDSTGGLLTTDVTNGDVRIQPNGVGIIEIDRLKITDDDITSLVTNGNIAITGNGTGGVTIEGVTFNGTSLSSADSTQIQINEQVDLGGNKIINLADPTSAQDAATKNYVDTQLSSSSHNITFVGDDSTGTAVTQGETFKFAGTQNITTAVSGDTLTITGPDLSSYATTSYVDAQNQSQALTFVGDDSTGTAVNSGETFKIAGTQNITTAVSGDTLTITGPDLSSYATQSYVTSQGYITNSTTTIVGDDSTGTTINSGETFKIAGTQNITTAVSGDTLTITGPDLSSYLTSETSHADVLVDGDFASAGFMKTDGAGTYSIDANTYLTSVAFGDLTSTPTTLSGYGITDAASSTATAVTVVGDDSSGTAVTLGETFKVAGATGITTAVSGDTLTITGPTLTSFITASSSDTLTNKTIDANGTGNSISNLEVADFAGSAIINVAETLASNDSDTALVTAGAIIDYVDAQDANIASDTLTFTNKTFDVEGTGNSISNIDVADFKAAAIVTAAEGIGSNNNDTTIPTSAAVKAYADSVGGGSTGDLTITGSTISSPSNGDLTLTTSGTGNIVANATFNFNGDALFDTGVQESFSTLTSATGTVTHDCDNGHVFRHTTPSANWTANFTNLSLTSSYATTLTLVIVQGATAYIPTAVQIGGSAQTLNWQGGSQPIGTDNGIDVVSFSILNVGGTYTVLGQLVDFG